MLGHTAVQLRSSDHDGTNVQKPVRRGNSSHVMNNTYDDSDDSDSDDRDKNPFSRGVQMMMAVPVSSVSRQEDRQRRNRKLQLRTSSN